MTKINSLEGRWRKDNFLTTFHNLNYTLANFMAKSTYAVKLDNAVKRAVADFCEARGLKQSAFVEQALCEQMERAEWASDLADLHALRPTESLAIPFDDYLKRRKRRR